MAHATDVILPTQPARGLPVVRSIGLGDLRYALTKGLEDFRAMPTHVIFLSLIYPIAGIAIWRATFGYDVVPLLYPLAAGFALIGPFAAIGLYELSRRRELGLDTSWKHAFDIIHSPSIWALAGLGLLLLAIFGVWLAVANGIYVANFGYRQPTTLAEFASMILDNAAGPQSHRGRQRGRVPLRGAGICAERGVVPAAARPQRRGAGGDCHLGAGDPQESGHDGLVGRHRGCAGFSWVRCRSSWGWPW